MRISTSQIYSQVSGSVGNSLNDYMDAINRNSSQKDINAPSDDPAGMAKVVNLRSYDSALEHYYENSKLAGEYLGSADGLLLEASTTMTSVLEKIEQASTGTYSDVQQQSISEELQSYQDSLLAVANSKLGSDYLFSGESTDTSPYEYVPGVTVTGDSPAKSDFTEITGELEDPIIVQFTSDGTIGTDAVSYTYSLDGGNSWTTGTMDGTATPPDTTMELGDVSVEMNSGTSVTAWNDDEDSGSSFVVRNSVAYKGADDAMSIDISESTDLDITTAGSDIFGGVDADTGDVYGDPNLFESISDAIAYAWIGDENGVSTTLDTVTEGNINLTNEMADVGVREEKADFTKTSLNYTRERVSEAISSEEDADSTALTIELSKTQYIYQAVLSSTSDVIGMSILDYL
ncbi:flagellar hook-associated protein FlgL [Maridesulfovibrio sp.]|uniref:flagellar hook-associated protein FlgL n=1 Tax=Maridesulfovibrio sp. TaxID=2795000 RepID=UPI0029CA05A7|nr:flagellar hook-associated protein FlgL [Maridesulfovibrio sp.]